jgi:hypothetical protein
MPSKPRSTTSAPAAGRRSPSRRGARTPGRSGWQRLLLEEHEIAEAFGPGPAQPRGPPRRALRQPGRRRPRRPRGAAPRRPLPAADRERVRARRQTPGPPALPGRRGPEDDEVQRPDGLGRRALDPPRGPLHRGADNLPAVPTPERRVGGVGRRRGPGRRGRRRPGFFRLPPGRRRPPRPALARLRFPPGRRPRPRRRPAPRGVVRGRGRVLPGGRGRGRRGRGIRQAGRDGPLHGAGRGRGTAHHRLAHPRHPGRPARGRPGAGVARTAGPSAESAESPQLGGRRVFRG